MSKRRLAIWFSLIVIVSVTSIGFAFPISSLHPFSFGSPEFEAFLERSSVDPNLLATTPSVSIATLGVAVTEDFNTLSNDTVNPSSAVPPGWAFFESGVNANTTYSVGTGSSSGGDTWSFGSTGSTERAFGQLRSGSLISTLGASFTNNTGSTIDSLNIAYVGEQWRLGATGRGADKMDFQYSLNATSLTTGTWVDVDALDFASPNTTTVGVLNGNSAANRTAKSTTISSLNIAAGSTFWIRWNDADPSGSDDGLAIDDFSITANGVIDSTQSTDYFRSKASGNWNAVGTWQSSHDGVTWIDATLTPDSSANTVTISAGHSVDVTAAVNVDQVAVNGTLIAEHNQLTVDDGSGTDIAVGSTGTLQVNGAMVNNGQIDILNVLQITTGSPTFTGTGSFTYDPNATLVYSGGLTMTVPNTASTAMFWPAVGGPQNFTITPSTGGADIQVPRTLDGTLATFGGLSGAQNLTINGTLLLEFGAQVVGNPTYGPNALLKYDFAGHAANRGDEWKQAVTSGPGYPHDVQVSGNTPLNIAFGATDFVQMGGKLTIDDGSSATMSGMFSPLNLGGGFQLDGTFSLSASGGDLHLIGGDWHRGTNGVLNRAGRNVFFESTNDQTIYGDNTFDGLYISATTARTVKFEAGKTQTSNSALQITGSAGNLVSLRSTVNGSQWKIVAANGASVNYADVKDSDATNSYPNGITPSNSVDSGNNTKWNFPIPVTLTDFAVSPSSGSEAAQSIITLTATLDPAPTTNKTVNITIDGTGITGDDYRNSLGNITVLAGQTTGSINITVNDDTEVEGPETAAVHASMDGVTKDASFSIVDNDSDPPTATNLSAAESYTEDTTLDLINIVVTDADSTTTTATLTLSSPLAGSLTTAISGTTTSTYNSSTGVWSASGPIAEVNALLASVSFVPAADFNSNFSIATSVTDGQSTPATGTKFMTGTAVNDAPTATNLSAAESYTEDTTRNLTDIVVSDVDSPTVSVTLTLSTSAAGSLTTSTSGSTTSTFDNGNGVWAASGPIAEVNALLASVSYVPAANYDSNFSITTSVSDGIAAAATGSKAMSGIPVNDAPVLDSSKSPAFITEGVDAGPPVGAVGTLVAQLIDPVPPIGQLDNVADVDSNALTGIAVIATDTTNGTWYYSTNGGATWNPMGAVSDAGSRLLAADGSTRIYFQPTAGFNGSIPAAITFRAWDQTAGTNGSVVAAVPAGNSAAFSTATDTASIVINAGSVEFSSATYSGVEGGSVMLTVNRSTSSGSTTVNYTVSGGTATGGTCSANSNIDYQAASGSLTFGQGDSSQTITIPLCADLFSESPAETYDVSLSGPTGSTLGSQTTATVSIIDAASEFVSSTPITLIDGQAGDQNPSSLEVAGYSGSILGVRLTLYNVTKTSSSDLSVMLVDPSGNRNLVVMTDVGGSGPMNSATITLEDAANGHMPQGSPLTMGTNYKPTSCMPDTVFASPAPAGPHNTSGCGATERSTFGDVFSGFNPNGTWKLYVMDESGTPLQNVSAVTGSIGGWGIQFLLPTAAPVSIGGRVRTPSGEGIRGAIVTLMGGDLTTPRTMRTGTFGNFRFDDLRPGTTYVVSIASAKYTFAAPVHAVTLMDSLAGIDFVSDRQE